LSISAEGYQEIQKKGPHVGFIIEILTCRAIILHLEDSRSHGKEEEAERSQALGARPVDLGARPLLDSNQDTLSGKISTDLKGQG